MTSKSSGLLKSVFAFFALYLAVFLVMMPQNCLNAAKKGIELCLGTIIPSLFPFFVCSGILSASGFPTLCSRFLSGFMRPLFRLPGAAAITFLLGTVSGYPVGASSAAELYESGQCTKSEAHRLIAFCNNSSPLFVIGVVGTGLLGNPYIGYILYAVHIISALAVGVIFRFFDAESRSDPRTLPPSEPKHNKKTAIFSFGGIIDNSVFSTLKVCGFIIFFSVFSEAVPNGFMKPYFCCITEITGGLQILTQAQGSGNMLLPLISLFLGFSGISVILQITAIISPKGLSPKPLITGKILQGIIAFLITLLVEKTIPVSMPTFSMGYAEFFQKFSPWDYILSSILSVFFTVMLLKGAVHIAKPFSGN